MSTVDRCRFRPHRRMRLGHLQTGMTLLELMIAMGVLAVGMGGVLVLFTGAISANNRNKVDTEAVLTSQIFLERISDANGTSFNVTDCQSNAITVTTVAGGAALDAVNKNIDWTQAAGSVPSGYLQTYVSCAGLAGTQVTFEVRWNITSPAVTGLAGSKLISVSTRPKNSPTGGLFVAVPITLRTIVNN